MKHFFTVIFIAVALFSTYHIIRNSYEKKIDKYQKSISESVGKARFLEHQLNIQSKLFNTELNETKLWKYNCTTSTLDEIVQYPCLIIYIPNSDNICGSCIDYSFKSVQDVFENNMNSKHIAIITMSYFPNLNPRIIKKEIFNLNGKSELISSENSNPIYLLINEEKKIISCYIPNIKWNKETLNYLEGVKDFLEK